MKGRRQFSVAEADRIRHLLHEKVRSDRDSQKKCRDGLRSLGFYISDFRDGGGPFTAADFDALINSGAVIVFTDDKSAVESVRGSGGGQPNQNHAVRKSKRDETYVIDLCDEILGSKAIRQYRFTFLVGDGGQQLPVDAYYPKINLVIEYHERQHREPVDFFDRRPTVSGVSRGEQRRLYDERRRQILPSKGIALVEVRSEHLRSDSKQRLVRDRKADMETLRDILHPWVLM